MKKTIFISLLVIGIVALIVNSCGLLSAAGLANKGLPTTKVPENLSSTTANSEVNLDHSQWDALLKKHVDTQGNVDYKGFQKDREALTKYLNYLSENKPTKKWSVQEQLAYYINAYNAFTVELILENYPLESIKDINSPWFKPFVPIGDVMISLGGIENSILRKMNEPRIHFAINCASISCPKLHNEAFTASKINEQLDLVTKNFINSSENQISENELKLSKIFEWYEKDYLVNDISSLAEYVNQYTDVKVNPNAKISFLDYDWSLNEKK
ncbi:MAG: DUF547 domain-containing protein [Flavobacteriaceae bacterium]